MAMADTATTASAAAASAASASTDAPPFQLGKPRFQQVRTGLWSEGWQVAQGGRANSPPKSPLALGSPTRGYPELAATGWETSATASPFPLVSGVGRGLPLWLPIGLRRRRSAAAGALQPLPPEALCDWPLPAAAGDAGPPGPSCCCRVALGCAAAHSRRKVRVRLWMRSCRERDAF